VRCSAQINLALLGIDPATGERAGAGPLGELLTGRRVALVGPSRPARPDQGGFDVRVTAILDDMSELELVTDRLSVQRAEFDAVLSTAAVPGKVLCARLARELGVVALDLGGALEQIPPARVAAAGSGAEPA
jgi:hypothetical protein